MAEDVEARFEEGEGVTGAERAGSTTVPSLPAGTLTFLLTDVEGSSRLWEADPDVASAAMARQEAIIADHRRRADVSSVEVSVSTEKTR